MNEMIEIKNMNDNKFIEFILKLNENENDEYFDEIKDIIEIELNNRFDDDFNNLIFQFCNEKNNELYDDCHESNYELINEFLLYYYNIDDIINYDNEKNYYSFYTELKDCIYYYYEWSDLLYDEIDEIFQIPENLESYIDYDKILYDLEMDEYFIIYNGLYFHNGYF